MSASRGSDFAHIVDLFSAFGPVSVRRMFSGAGVFSGGVMIGLISRGAIYLKADAGSIAEFQREGLGPFGYDTSRGRRVLTSYWRMPDRLYDSPEELAEWVRRAHAAALHAAAFGRGPGKTAPRRARTAKRLAKRRQKK